MSARDQAFDHPLGPHAAGRLHDDRVAFLHVRERVLGRGVGGRERRDRDAALRGAGAREQELHVDFPRPAARDRVSCNFERRYVEAVLAKHGGNVGAAARASGVARTR